eukprot:GEMP01063824.1.p2 GENE.GEMP01063824.1~~GEMP01063824.1.p2  ORF type:complete len:101 (-),score=2.35 GEMP01063824.1:764-1066(-)
MRKRKRREGGGAPPFFIVKPIYHWTSRFCLREHVKRPPLPWVNAHINFLDCKTYMVACFMSTGTHKTRPPFFRRKKTHIGMARDQQNPHSSTKNRQPFLI